MKTGLLFPVVKQKRKKGGGTSEDKSVKQVLAAFDVPQKVAFKSTKPRNECH